MENNERTPIVQLVGKKILSSQPNPMLGDVTPFVIHVKTIDEEYNSYAKLKFMILSESGKMIMAGNEIIDGDNYANWDGNDLDYPYKFVAERRGLTIQLLEQED